MAQNYRYFDNLLLWYIHYMW